MRQCPLKYKECPLKRPLSDRVVRSLEIQVAKATNRQKNGFAVEIITTQRTYLHKYHVDLQSRLSHWIHAICVVCSLKNTN